MGVHKDDKGSKHNTGHNTGHKKKESSIISEAAAGLAALKTRRARLKDPFGDDKPKKRPKPKPKKKVAEADRFAGMSPEQISRALNIQRIKSASKDTARKRSLLAQLRGLRKRSKRGAGFQFIEGKTKF